MWKKQLQVLKQLLMRLISLRKKMTEDIHMKKFLQI